jgi:hypothetical protein
MLPIKFTGIKSLRAKPMFLRISGISTSGAQG